LIILSSELKKGFLEEVKLKALYASKNDTLKELKEKILRCYGHILEKNAEIISNSNNFKDFKDFNLLQMYNGKGNGKRLLVNLIYHFKINAKKFRVPGRFLIENKVLLNVKFFKKFSYKLIFLYYRILTLTQIAIF